MSFYHISNSSFFEIDLRTLGFETKANALFEEFLLLPIQSEVRIRSFRFHLGISLFPAIKLEIRLFKS
ncbi:hypothetical protein CH380_09400 [Leptospira adleri]|uniref:Uncharacterized protein n=1 Tax=Leptospira adleri TaxID=2023186 RepID=A0A2M9YPC5_9LEPT|nr:hypothetical protein CH380_09400 [Leptospira adleri]PJZ61847.1 hypothetical protein CH376_11415 [Leptospira adleri]